jgi:hypothetical protein
VLVILKNKKYTKKEIIKMSVSIDRLRDLSRRTQAGLAAIVLTLAATAPVFFAGSASAAPALLNRKLTSTSARPSQTTQLTWTFDTTSAVANIKQIELEFCTNPLGACSAASTTVAQIAASPTATLGGFTTNTVTSTTRVNSRTTPATTNTQINIVKTNADAGASLTNLSVQLGASDITNPSNANQSYYTRARLYSDTGTTLVWEGVFAQSTSQTLTVNARVQERLDFCVGSTTVDDATTNPGAACANIAGTSVDIGNIDSSATNVSPVQSTNGGDAKNGIAMIRTNAVNGATVAYHALGDAGSGTLKVPGATCVASPVSNTGTDQCFNTASAQGAFTAGGEKFGMTIAGINCGSTTAYTCNFGNDAYNLRRDTAYDGNGTTGVGSTTYGGESSDQVAGTTANGYAWDADPANTTTIASSTSSGIKVIDDEAMILKFAATSGITTPTGSYTVQADFIATTTF